MQALPTWASLHMLTLVVVWSCLSVGADEYLADFIDYKPGRPDDAVFAFPDICAPSAPKTERHPFPTAAFQMSRLLLSTRRSKPYRSSTCH